MIGVARRDQEHEDFRDAALESIERYSRRKPDPDVLNGLLDDMRYVPGSFDDDEVYAELRRTLEEFDEPGRPAAGPRLLPVHRARVLPGDRRQARRGRPQRRARTPRSGS